MVAEYRDITRTYADLVGKITDLLDSGMESEIDVLRRSCRRVWDSAEKARLTLARHEANHFCDRTDLRASSSVCGSPPA
jgi:hypothetical protein